VVTRDLLARQSLQTLRPRPPTLNRHSEGLRTVCPSSAAGLTGRRGPLDRASLPMPRNQGSFSPCRRRGCRRSALGTPIATNVSSIGNREGAMGVDETTDHYCRIQRIPTVNHAHE